MHVWEARTQTRLQTGTGKPERASSALSESECLGIELDRGNHIPLTACDRLWQVESGVVATCTILDDGRRQIVMLATPGDVVCPVKIGLSSDSWAEALTRSHIVQAWPRFKQTSNGKLDKQAADLFHLAHQQLQLAAQHIVALGRLDGMERLCLLLADLAERIGVDRPEGRRVALPLAREDMADYLGLNADTVSRILSRVKKAGLVTFISPSEYIVPDTVALQSAIPITVSNKPRSVPGAG